MEQKDWFLMEIIQSVSRGRVGCVLGYVIEFIVVDNTLYHILPRAFHGSFGKNHPEPKQILNNNKNNGTLMHFVT